MALRTRSVGSTSNNASTEDSGKIDSSGTTSSGSSTGLQQSDSSNTKVANKNKTAKIPSKTPQSKTVPSRYKQSAANVAEKGHLDKTLLADKLLTKPSSAGWGTILRSTLEVKAKPGLLTGLAVKQGGSPTHAKRAPVQSRRSAPGSPAQERATTKRFTVGHTLPDFAHLQLQSTLAMEPDMSLLPSWDVSVLSALDERKSGLLTAPSDRHKTGAVTPSCQSPRPQRHSWTVDDLSLLHTDYLMSLYAYMQADAAARRVEEEAQASQHARFQRNERLAQTLHEKRALSETLERAITLNEQLHQQTQVLSPLLDELPRGFPEKYAEFGEALEATRHRLPLHNIHVPDQDTQALSERLYDVLADTSSLAAGVPGLVCGRLPGLSDTARALARVKQGTQATVEEEASLEEAVLSLSALKLKELFLRVQEADEADVLCLRDNET